MRTKIGLFTLVFAGLGVALVAGAFFRPAAFGVTGLLNWAAQAGLWGPLVLVALYVLCCVFLIPGVIPTLAAGFLFGLPVGSITAVAGSMLGACTAFLLGRTTIRRWVAGRVARSGRFTAIDKAIGQRGFRVVLLSRLSPISPFIFLNYLFGLTRVSLRQYIWGSLIGMLPGTILFVYMGAGLHSMTEVTAHAGGRGGLSGLQQALFWSGLSAMAAVVLVLARMARDALQQTVCSPAQESVDVPADDPH